MSQRIAAAFKAPAATGNPIRMVLHNIPLSATTNDIRRLLLKHKLQEVSAVHLDYERFIPTGKAYITLTSPDCLEKYTQILSNVTLSGNTLNAKIAFTPRSTSMRFRGAQGRQEAAERGAVVGTGDGSEIGARAKEVVLWGLPGKMKAEEFKEYLGRHNLVVKDARGQADCEVLKIAHPGLAAVSKFVVRLQSFSEAFRLVRRMHMTTYRQPHHVAHTTPFYRVYARVLY